ncbi:TPA: DUF6516 family protein [Salmonella enterica]
MPSEMVMYQKFDFTGEDAFIRVKVWWVDPNVPASQHNYKYSLVYVVSGVCVLRYDNEAGKGDHKHMGDNEYPVSFTSLQDLLAQFQADVTRMRS